MTVCIAAVCEDKGKDVFVLATDHMIDVGIGLFEHDIRKHKKINGKNIVMLSGTALIFNELISGIQASSSFPQIKQKIYENFVNLKKDYINKQLLSKFGLTEVEVKDSLKGPIQNPIMAKLIDSIAKFDLNTSILLIGFENGKSQIAEIREHGYADFGDIHFHAIGSGQVQAINTLLFQRQSKCDSLFTTIYNVYKAKRNAEVSAGVGKETDMLVMREDWCGDISKEDLESLSKIYEAELHFGKDSSKLKELKILGIKTIDNRVGGG